MTRVYGHSDDCIEIDGDIYDEDNLYDGTISFTVSDGTKGTIGYKFGLWKIEVDHKGDLFHNKINANEDVEHTGEANGCANYSDVLILKDGVDWIKIGNKKFK